MGQVVAKMDDSNIVSLNNATLILFSKAGLSLSLNTPDDMRPSMNCSQRNYTPQTMYSIWTLHKMVDLIVTSLMRNYTQIGMKYT